MCESLRVGAGFVRWSPYLVCPVPHGCATGGPSAEWFDSAPASSSPASAVDLALGRLAHWSRVRLVARHLPGSMIEVSVSLAGSSTLAALSWDTGESEEVIFPFQDDADE